MASSSAAISGGSTPADRVAVFKESNGNRSETLNLVLEEVIQNAAPKVVMWETVPTSGSAVCRYDDFHGPREYDVKYQEGDVGISSMN
jgi:hypothetical protein